MKNIIFIMSLLLSLSVSAQTKVVKRNAVKANDFGITYSLPKTNLVVGAEVTKVTCKAGPYYKYAEKYLNVKDIVLEDQVYYELDKIKLENKGVPDSENTYIVSFKPGTVAPFACLTEDGLLCSINSEYIPAKAENNDSKKSSKSSTKADASVYSEELLMAGSTAKQAEVAAKQIYRIRESRMNILTGDADNLPPDGEAMKLVIQQLEEQENALTALFVGTKVKESQYYDVTVVPSDDLKQDVLFRFSPYLGILNADDLGGEPIYIDLTATERAPILDEKEAEKKEKSLKGIVYNIPGKANVEIYSNKKTFFKGEAQITQFGSKEALAPVMFEDKKAPVKVIIPGKANVEIYSNKKTFFKGEAQITQFGSKEALAPVMFEDKKAPVKVIFYPETGAIKQIIQ